MHRFGERLLNVTGRFLGLAAALLTVGSNFEAAQTLHTLLNDFSPKDQMLPTVRQLKDMFESLEVKLRTSGFANILMGWSTLMFAPGSVMESLFLRVNEDFNTDDQGPRSSSARGEEKAARVPAEIPQVSCEDNETTSTHSGNKLVATKTN